MSQRAAGSAYASGFVIEKNRPKNGPKFQYFVLLQELEKRSISIRQLALALELTPNVVKGAQGEFPLEKLEQCIDLLNNWTGPTSNRQSGPYGKPVNKPDIAPVTREMLVSGLAES